MIFVRRLAGQGRERLFTIERDTAAGWVAREQDDYATHISTIRNWRRVEAMMALFELKASALRNKGWLEIAPSA